MFNEDSRVKIPTILHLCRLGYNYLSLKGARWDKETNVFPEIFEQSLSRMNPNVEVGDIKRYYSDLSLMLENEDLGREFFGKLKQQTGIKLIDFEDFDNNSFHVVTELPCEK